MSEKVLSKEELIDLVLASFQAEREHKIAKNHTYLHDEFTVTDMVISGSGKIFPRLEGYALEKVINEAFVIKGREFIFPTIVADEETQTVIVEFIESYPDPKTKKIYRTPQVAICKIKDGKIYRTRHYMDPRLSYEYLDQSVIDDALK